MESSAPGAATAGNARALKLENEGIFTRATTRVAVLEVAAGTEMAGPAAISLPSASIP